MTDDDFDKVDEDFASEFDFVDNKEGGGTSASPQSSAPQPQPKGSPPIVTLLIIISILGGGYYVYSNFISKKPQTIADSTAMPPVANSELPTLPEHMEQTATSETPAAEQAMPPQPEAVAEALNQPNNELSQALPPIPGEKTFAQMQKEVQTAKQTQLPAQNAQSTEMHAALQTIAEDITENVNNIRQLEGSISNIASTLDHLNRTISAMDNRVVALTQTVDGLSQDLGNVKRVMVEQDLDLTMPGNVKMSASQSKKHMQTISSSEPNYSVHAIIPGRAWLKAANGQIITVTEGDKIGDYGTVAVIDAANGLVRTSSGIIIR